MNPIADPLLMELDSEAQTLRKVLERVPAKQFAWKPMATWNLMSGEQTIMAAPRIGLVRALTLPGWWWSEAIQRSGPRVRLASYSCRAAPVCCLVLPARTSSLYSTTS